MSKWRLAGWDRGKEREERKERVIGQVGSRSRTLAAPNPPRRLVQFVCFARQSPKRGLPVCRSGFSAADIGANRIGTSASSDAIIVLRLRGLRQEFCRCYFVLDLPFDLPCYLSYHYYHYDYQYCLLLPD